MKKLRYSPIWLTDKDQFKKLIAESTSWSDVLAFYGLANKGNNFKTVKKRIKEEQLDTSHFTHGNVLTGRIRQIPLEHILVENSSYNRSALKARLLKLNLLFNRCAGVSDNGKKCQVVDHWLGDPIVLVLDHINGEANDNRLSNLRLLCPNCNSRTSTFAGKRLRKKYNCIGCGAVITKGATRCRVCAGNDNRTDLNPLWDMADNLVEDAELAKLVWEFPIKTLAKRFGISATALRYRCKDRGIVLPSKSHWQKIRAGHDAKALKKLTENLAVNKEGKHKYSISDSELALLVWTKPVVLVAKEFGVSDKAIHKRCRLRNIITPPRGYWARVQAGQDVSRLQPDFIKK